MNKGYPIEGHDAGHEARWLRRIRYFGSLLGIWAACATCIYLIGPSELEAASLAVAAAQSLAGCTPYAAAECPQ